MSTERGRGRCARRQRGKNLTSNSNESNNDGDSNASQFDSTSRRKQILLLHGNRQTGQILLGRMEKLKKILSRELGLEFVAPDSPHLFFDESDLANGDANGDGTEDLNQWQRTWWHRKDNTYQGLEKSVSMLDKLWNEDDREFVAIFGFSQGSRLAHLISILHTITNGEAFPGLKCLVHVSGYGDRPRPDNFCALLDNHRWKGNLSSSMLEKLNDENYNFDDIRISQSSIHVMGEADTLIPLKSSKALLKWYLQPSVYSHPGSHFVPVKKHDIEKYVNFFRSCDEKINSTSAQWSAMKEHGGVETEKASMGRNTASNIITAIAPDPDEEHAQTQINEVFSLASIFPTEFCLLSESTAKDPENFDPDDYFEENRMYQHPIKYSILLNPQNSTEKSEEQLWPPKSISLCIQYPAKYPDISPTISLIHDMNYLEFSMQASDALLDVVRNAMEQELGMPCIMGMVYAATAFFEEGQLASCKKAVPQIETRNHNVKQYFEKEERSISTTSTLLRPSDATRIKKCNAQGLQVASGMLGRAYQNDVGEVASMDETTAGRKGGKWRFTVGLVGKPSAGKSTFFNAATAFARQRGEGGGEVRSEDKNAPHDEESEIILGGASMAPHPFTTIDPNIGYCLVPAPVGTCPEDEEDDCEKLVQCGLTLGSSHGRNANGTRFIPVCLKDVAGLVPGAYLGRGRGNKFLDDLTDADVLVHIVDASGSSDAEGNKLCNDGNPNDLTHPLHDLEWVRNELVEWVYFNVSSKWDSIAKRGKQKLIGMFSGYKQSQSFTNDVFVAVEHFVKDNEGRDDIFDHLETWDEGDLHRLVSTFLGARFPMALALNKADISSSVHFTDDIKSKLPCHGAHVGVSLSAHDEMKFIRHQIKLAIKSSSKDSLSSQCKPTAGLMSGRVWDCLQSAVSLRQPTLVFPVNDMDTLEPLPGLTNGYATRDSSLPNDSFVSCITAAGGNAPSQWDSHRAVYTSGGKGDVKHALRDVILLKPGSTVEDVFLVLKGMGALEGEFVRAEGSSRIGEKPKPVAKSELVGRQNRIIRIMTTNRKVKWQKKR